METNPVIEKIRKLLALANSCNEHEAALAASHAQRLLSEHNLAMADIESEQKPQSADKVETAVSKTLPKWVRHLSAGVCSAFDCQAIHHPALGRMTFIGVGADVQIAAYTFAYLDKTVRKLCSSYIRQHVNAGAPNRQRELMRQSYYLGAVTTITGRLREQKVRTPITPGALVPVKAGLIKKTIAEMGPIRTVHSRKSYINSHAYSTGQQDGRQVGIHKGVTGSSPAQKIISLLTIILLCLTGCAANDYRTASRASAGMAPNPATNREAVLQIYGAPAWGWRGWFAIHTWIAAKPANAESYTVYEVIGWRQRRGLPVVRIERDLPDRYWYGERPRLLKDVRGESAGKLIEAVDHAAKSYPWADTYKAFPGPNSNTFTAWIGRQVPELGLDLPFSAIGSGYAK